MSLKRHRPCGSDGNLGASSMPNQGGAVVLLSKVIELFDEEAHDLTHIEEHKDNLACPFWKHNPSRYLHVTSACTNRFGFKDIGKLTEHIKRVHCLWNGCERCGKRFNKYKLEQVREEKQKHMLSCTNPDKWRKDSDAEWMTEAQDEAYGQLNFQKDKGNPDQCYKKICRALWGPNYHNEIPEPYHRPGFDYSVLRWKFVKKLERLELQKRPEGSYQNARNETAISAPPLVHNHDPMLSQQALSDLSSGPQPFYRSQNRKDSGVWSYDRSSENQLAFAKPTVLDYAYDDGGIEDHSAMAQMTGAWDNFSVPNGHPSLELDEDGDEGFGL
ncbi:uncharacterized protein F4807DRAFT_403708 [Annulohypoxylon truncatum]|uniref:uncharacterized protein n=1 Tax=Annulohypoxylon truncatum TaxID=327061 RepID=UPI0020077CA8|nr:uncharacterized protein F4807DRAFT_403708 [Annulohypoxylon truncatum]KAI1214548.1 hypothetical protein F4807DRAFT_403708 [Annulohypoxylon truncatum]